MKPISEAQTCQIELTNICSRKCLYCSRYNRHIRRDQLFFMELDFLEAALDSLRDWPGTIGIIGGEPILHPGFEECCRLIQSKFPKSKMALWTSGGPKWKDYLDIIGRTFHFVAFNEHNEHQKRTCKHQPITLAIEDVVPDERLRTELIEDCWVQRTWCPTIGPKGAFFCEVAYAIDTILDGPGGYEINDSWWRRTPDQFMDQVSRYCGHCGMAIPIEREHINKGREKFSPGSLELFRRHRLPGVEEKDVEIFDRVLSREQIEENAETWFPGNYRGDRQEDILSGEGRGSTRFGLHPVTGKSRLKILFCRGSQPYDHAFYFERALRERHNVITYGPVVTDGNLKGWQLEDLGADTTEADIPYFTADLGRVLDMLPWVPDLFFYTRTLLNYHMFGIKAMPCPTACFVLDPDYLTDYEMSIARHFDYVFISQKDWIEKFRINGMKNVFWLTHACDPALHGGDRRKKTHDVTFIGTLTPERQEALNRLSARFNVHCERSFGKKAADAYAQSKIVFNMSSRGEINMRVFEALASGSFLITDRSDASGLTELFRDGEHLAYYGSDEELYDRIGYYLRHEQEREDIAQAGMREVMENHTYGKRVEAMIDIMQPFISRQKPAVHGRSISILGEEERRDITLAHTAMEKMLDPDNQEIVLRYANALIEKGRYGDAAAALEQAVALNPENVTARDNLRDLKASTDKMGEAEGFFQENLRTHPDNLTILKGYADFLSMVSRKSDAIECYIKIISLSPDDTDSYYDLGAVFLCSGEIDKAIACFEKALALNPEHENARSNLESVLYRFKDGKCGAHA